MKQVAHEFPEDQRGRRNAAQILKAVCDLVQLSDGQLAQVLAGLDAFDLDSPSHEVEAVRMARSAISRILESRCEHG